VEVKKEMYLLRKAAAASLNQTAGTIEHDRIVLHPSPFTLHGLHRANVIRIR
jgi:hypothetical protein